MYDVAADIAFGPHFDSSEFGMRNKRIEVNSSDTNGLRLPDWWSHLEKDFKNHNITSSPSKRLKGRISQMRIIVCTSARRNHELDTDITLERKLDPELKLPTLGWVRAGNCWVAKTGR
jgi:hypothetical protein